MDLSVFAADVGEHGRVTVSGLGTRGGPVPSVRCVRPPGGIEWMQPDEMTVCCGAGTPVDELAGALAAVGQRVALPAGGTVGGALSVGRAGIRRLGDGPVRESLLQARYIGAGGEIVKAGGPTVKNVSGFDVCRLLVGARGTLGFLGEVILRTHPIALSSQWFRAPAGADPFALRRLLYHPVSILWDGTATWALLEGHPTDVGESAQLARLEPVDGPPPTPTAYRWSVPVSRLPGLGRLAPGSFIAEIGVGVVHHTSPPPAVAPDSMHVATQRLHRRVKLAFDPADRLNPAPEQPNPAIDRLVTTPT